MSKANEHLEDLAHIRSLMEQSSRFISLSGLSGVSTGIYAILGVLVLHLNGGLPLVYPGQVASMGEFRVWGSPLFVQTLMTAAAVLVLSLATAFYLTSRKARKNGLKVWTTAARHMVTSLAIPLAAGALFIGGLLFHHLILLIPAATLIFYGLALINAGKYTLHKIGYLGMADVALGMLALFQPGYGLVYWLIGFGVLHIGYGWVMYGVMEKEASL